MESTHKKKQIIYRLIFLFSSTLLLTACNNNSGQSANMIHAAGEVSMGTPVASATVSVYGIDHNGNVSSSPIAQTTTDNSGQFQLNIENEDSYYLYTTHGGSYTNPVNSSTTNLTINLHAISNGSDAQVAITPLTESMYQYANAQTGGLSSSNIAAARTAGINFLYGSDAINTLPANALTITNSNFNSSSQVYALALATLLQFSSDNNYPLTNLLQWTTPQTNTCLASPYLPTGYTIANLFFANLCHGQGNGTTGQPTSLDPLSFGFLSDPAAIFYHSADHLIEHLNLESLFANPYVFRTSAETIGNTAGTADTSLSLKGPTLKNYLDSFNVREGWLAIQAGGSMVNWQTGLISGSGYNCTSITEPVADTFCSSFVSAVTYTGYSGLFTVGTIPFLSPYNGPAATILHPGQTLPMVQCARRDFLTGFQHEWLLGTLNPGPPPTEPSINQTTWNSWDYNARPMPENTGWHQVTSTSSDANIVHAKNLAPLTSNSAIDSMILAQRLANEGYIVVASFAPSTEGVPGHITAIYPNNKSQSDIINDGPNTISAGSSNYPEITIRQAFNIHSCDGGQHENYCPIGAWESMSTNNPQILFFYFDYDQ